MPFRVGNRYISGLMVNRQLWRIWDDMPRTQKEFIGLCRSSRQRRRRPGVQGLCLWDALQWQRSSSGGHALLLDAYTDSEYVQWLNLYRNNPQGFPFENPAFARVLKGIDELESMGLYENGDFLMSKQTESAGGGWETQSCVR